MKMDVYIGDFRDRFKAMGRDGGWSYEGLEALYDYLEEIFDGEYNLDVVELCGIYSEYKDLEEYNKDTGNDYDCSDDIEEIVARVGDDGFIVAR